MTVWVDHACFPLQDHSVPFATMAEALAHIALVHEGDALTTEIGIDGIHRVYLSDDGERPIAHIRAKDLSPADSLAIFLTLIAMVANWRRMECAQ